MTLLISDCRLQVDCRLRITTVERKAREARKEDPIQKFCGLRGLCVQESGLKTLGEWLER